MQFLKTYFLKPTYWNRNPKRTLNQNDDANASVTLLIVSTKHKSSYKACTMPRRKLGHYLPEKGIDTIVSSESSLSTNK